MSARSATRPAIDWNTVELVGDLEPMPLASAQPSRKVERVFPDRRGRSDVKKILSGASMKARGNGARLTHGQICKKLRPGLDVLAYGVGLLAAATAFSSDPARSVTLAAYVIGEASERLADDAVPVRRAI